MCGIAGILAPGKDARELEPVLESLLEGIRHRGPDDSGRLVQRGLAMGMRRLSIIDIEGGHQPMTTATQGTSRPCWMLEVISTTKKLKKAA